jgi:hypothetical protein
LWETARWESLAVVGLFHHFLMFIDASRGRPIAASNGMRAFPAAPSYGDGDNVARLEV